MSLERLSESFTAAGQVFFRIGESKEDAVGDVRYKSNEQNGVTGFIYQPNYGHGEATDTAQPTILGQYPLRVYISIVKEMKSTRTSLLTPEIIDEVGRLRLGMNPMNPDYHEQH